MKKFFIALLAAMLVFVGCATQAPLSANVNFPQDGAKYRILGRVTLDAKTGKAGYVKLLEKAKSTYPECDDVINIMIDATGSKGKYTHYLMTGIAIDYVEVK